MTLKVRAVSQPSILTALALVPAGAHLFELPNKIGLAQDQYFIVQSIYRRLGAVRDRAVPGVLAADARPRRSRCVITVRPIGFALVGIPRIVGEPGDLLHLHLSGERRDQQLDRCSRRTGRSCVPAGRFARRECRRHVCRALSLVVLSTLAQRATGEGRWAKPHLCLTVPRPAADGRWPKSSKVDYPAVPPSPTVPPRRPEVDAESSRPARDQ